MIRADKAGMKARIGDITIARRSLYDPVADQLRAMIIRGELAPGDRVPVTELAASLGVSVTPLREALKVLARDQLVDLLPNRGARVSPYTADDASALFDVIASLEGLAAELATARLTPADLDALEALHVRMAEHFERGEKEPYFELNNRIHEAIIRLSGNDVLISTHAKLIMRATRGRYIAIVDRSRWIEAMAEHEDLMGALRVRDAERAGVLWRLHLRRTGHAVRAALTAGGGG
jgi:DNA-binding GntR family transcriptional regulator